MSANLVPTCKMLVDRALHLAKLSIDKSFDGLTAGSASTTTVSRTVRATNSSDSAKRAFTVAVTLTEIATASVAGASPTTTMDDITNP